MSHRGKAKVVKVTFRFPGKWSTVSTVRLSPTSLPSVFSWIHLGFLAHLECAGHSPASGCFWLFYLLPGSPCSLMFSCCFTSSSHCSVFSPACSRSLPISSHCFFFSVSTYVVHLFMCILCFYFSVLNCIYMREEFSFCCIYPNIQDLEYYLYFIRHSINIC